MSNSTKFLKKLVQRINSSGTIENVSNRVNVQLENARHVAVQKYNDLIQNVNDSGVFKSVIQAAVKEPSPMPVKKSNSKKFFKNLVQRINSSGTIENVSNRVDVQLENARNVAVQKDNDLIKNVNDSSVFKSDNEIQAAVKEPSPVTVNLINSRRWYQKITGLEDVESAQHQVTIVQNNLSDCQARRRQLNYEDTEMNDKLKQIYSELLHTRRDGPKYVQLTILENKGLQEQVKICDELKRLDNEEKDLFTHLATAMKEYHEKQTRNARKYKYLLIFATSLMATVSLCASTMYKKRIRDLENAVIESQKQRKRWLSGTWLSWIPL